MNRNFLLLISLLTLVAFAAACGTPRARGRGGSSDDDDSALDDDDSASTDDDDDDDDDDGTDDDDDDSGADDDDAVPDDLFGIWTGTPSGTIDVGGTIYDCDPTSEAMLEVTNGGLATGTLSCFLEGLALLCTAAPVNVNVNAGPAPVLVSCLDEFVTLEWNTDGQTYLGGWLYGEIDIGQIVVVDIAFTLQRDL